MVDKKKEVQEIKPEKKRAKDLQMVENKLSKIFEEERKNWISTYKLMKRVKEEELWVGMYKNYTAWVKHLGIVNDYNPSVLWARYKAGQDYLDFKNSIDGENELPPLEEVKSSPDSINLVIKILKEISTYDSLTKKIDPKKLMMQVAHGEIPRKQLRDEKHEVERQISLGIVDGTGKGNSKDTNESYITNVDASNVFKNDHSWLNTGDADKDKNAYYRVVSDININDAKTNRVDFLNMVVLENLTNEKKKNDEVNLHVMTLMNKLDKFEKMDNSFKLSEIGDYYWLVVPERFEKEGREYFKKVYDKNRNNGFGLILLKKKDDKVKIEVVNSSAEHMAEQKMKVLTSVLTSDFAQVGGNLHNK